MVLCLVGGFSNQMILIQIDPNLLPGKCPSLRVLQSSTLKTNHRGVSQNCWSTKVNCWSSSSSKNTSKLDWKLKALWDIVTWWQTELSCSLKSAPVWNNIKQWQCDLCMWWQFDCKTHPPCQSCIVYNPSHIYVIACMDNQLGIDMS